MNVDLEEFRSAFVAEAEEHLSGVQSLLLAVERSLRDDEAGAGVQRELRELLRLLHTIKGLSAMVGVEPVVVLAHAMEEVIRGAERSGGVLEERAIEVLLGGTRAIEARVRNVSRNEPVPPPAADLLSALARLEPPEPAVTSDVTIEDPIVAKLGTSELQQLRQGTRGGRRALRVDFTPSAEKALAGVTITAVRERVGALADIVKVVPLTGTGPNGLVFALVLLTGASEGAIADAAGVAPSEVTQLLAAGPPPAPPSGITFAAEADDDDTASSRGVLRVEVGRIDDAIEMLGTLVVTRSRMAHAVERLEAKGVDARELRAVMVDHARQLRELRAAILRVRMVPMTAVLDRLPLVVRGLARTNGKKVRVALDVGTAELDKTVAERLFPALVHIVRNAVDHGIELPAERVRAGKPETATLTIQGTTRDRLVELRIRDDGRGVDAAAVAARAGSPMPASDAELLDLLCRTGLSTRTTADTTSGRGLGMDIVRKVVQRLGGDLVLETAAGEGTTFVLRVPLTVAIVEAFTVRSGGERFAVPVPVVEEILELSAERVVTGPDEKQLLARRGDTVLLLDLAGVLALPSTRAPQALVVRGARGDLVAYAVERVLGQQEIVVRPLVDPLVASGAISGATDLGDGRVTVVLDLLALAGRAA